MVTSASGYLEIMKSRIGILHTGLGTGSGMASRIILTVWRAVI